MNQGSSPLIKRSRLSKETRPPLSNLKCLLDNFHQLCNITDGYQWLYIN